MRCSGSGFRYPPSGTFRNSGFGTRPSVYLWATIKNNIGPPSGGPITYVCVHVYSLQLLQCDECQHQNGKISIGTPQLNPIAVKAPWYQIGINFVGPISSTGDDGSRYVLTIADYFTKWVEAIATPDKTSATVSSALFKVRELNHILCIQVYIHFYISLQLFMRMGLPQVIISDNGREFNNDLDKKISDLLGIKRRLTTPYHPQVCNILFNLLPFTMKMYICLCSLV